MGSPAVRKSRIANFLDVPVVAYIKIRILLIRKIVRIGTSWAKDGICYVVVV